MRDLQEVWAVICLACTAKMQGQVRVMLVLSFGEVSIFDGQFGLS